MKEEFIPHIATPKIPEVSQTPASAAYKEAHAEKKLADHLEEEITVTRIFILEKYAIPPEHVLVISPSKSNKAQRHIRAFSILSNTENPKNSFYAEGHTAHVTLHHALIEKFSKEIGVLNLMELFDSETFALKKPWVIRKGFLDPFHNGFREFPSIHNELVEQLEECREINGISEDEIYAMEKDECELPNWFLSSDTSKEI
ncbi:hypothetical protein COU49_02805 [Candidatus Nomurabacteria bacterium CG10_big_fil_rev_8_21_14_0_10_35_16]|uniref:Uncharacterized protein n=1 Tax=Candidatus Nomurabacteria bacterium CG10_big_fil_rev_8_21_14_0_10_35_16 TaxID=1974731 RepID=A0A2H0TAQ6_9BACT|nr:MAG: hypothetical protein COU49_02805 [Candidatus Nomurabacteria bacterium CG10_big_fil_rev_8_21_14_0_10_35_16]